MPPGAADTMSPIESTEFAVELPSFSGPFRLLADLILEQKMDVCDVPLARITERFLKEGLEAASWWPLEEATWFLAACAALLELKVGRLLPRPQTETEEDLLGGISPDLLYARSLELSAFRRVADDLAERMQLAARMVPRDVGPPAELAHLYPDVLERVTAVDLGSLVAGLLAPAPEVDLSHVAPIRVTLADAVRDVGEHLAVKGDSMFRDLVFGCEERIEVVIRFLALLELHREGKVELHQGALFGDIEVRWRGGDSGAGGASSLAEDGREVIV